MNVESKSRLNCTLFIIQYGADKRQTNDNRTFSLKEGKNKVYFSTARHNNATSFRIRLKFGMAPCSFKIVSTRVSQKNMMNVYAHEMERIGRTRRYVKGLELHDGDASPIDLEPNSGLLPPINTTIEKEEYGYLISVIVPIYNTEKYVPKCIESLLNQTIKDIEIIAVNDGSTDDSLSVLKKYKAEHPEKITIIDQRNKGPGAARNAGIKIARGKYIMFLDSDDSYTSNCCEKLYRHLRNYDYDMVIGHIGWDDDGKIVPQENLEKKLSKFSDRRFSNLRNDTNAVFVNVVCTLYSSKLIKDNQILFPEGIYWEDMPFSLQAWFFSKQIGYVSDIIYIRVKRDNSITQTFNMRTLLDRIEIAKLIGSMFETYGLSSMYKYFEWTISDIENRIELLQDPQDKDKALAAWSKEKEAIIQLRDYHEKIFIESKK